MASASDDVQAHCSLVEAEADLLAKLLKRNRNQQRPSDIYRQLQRLLRALTVAPLGDLRLLADAQYMQVKNSNLK